LLDVSAGHFVLSKRFFVVRENRRKRLKRLMNEVGLAGLDCQKVTLEGGKSCNLRSAVS
jgi:hypothetical protein